MTDFINSVYFDKIRYVLSKIPQLDLSSDELMLVLSILILQEEGQVVSVESIKRQTGLDIKEIDKIVTILAGKRYLEVEVVDTAVNFSVDNIFKLKPEVNLDVSDLFKIFEEEFSRLLNQRELVRLNEWMKKYKREEIIDALRSASIMEKLDFNYINKILENNHESK